MLSTTNLRIGLTILLMALSYPFYAQIIYVNREATGMNDGTTWENAFTDLESALASASDQQSIWIAKGIYHPGGPTPDNNAVFAVRHNVSIYGGFAGNEMSLEERDIHAHETILSGDLNNDDITGEFVDHKDDNTLHVVYVDSLLDKVTLDGLIIKGGHTGDHQDSTIYYRAGGGIYALSPVRVNACSFQNHFGRSGASILLTDGASHSSITESTFSSNKTTAQSAGIYALTISNLTISGCTFKDNQTVRGAVYPAYCHGILVENSLFQDNHNTVLNGGALFSFQNVDLVVRNCDFIRNSAIVGGAVVINSSEVPFDSLTHIRIEDCRFMGNSSSEWAGAIYCLTTPDISISGCSFDENYSSAAGAIFIEQPGTYVTHHDHIQINRCQFRENRADDFGGGALFLRFTGANVEHCRFESNFTNGFNNGGGGHIFINAPGRQVLFRYDTMQYGVSNGFAGAATAYGKDAAIQFEKCLFHHNSADLLGGAVHHHQGSVVTYDDCEFVGNQSILRSGGALSIEYDSTTVRLNQSLFINNAAPRGNGGAIFAGFGSNRVIIDQCSLSLNQAGYIGGAIMMRETGDDDLSELIIRNTQLGFNAASNEGGAIYTEDADLEIISSVLYGNLCNGAGKGGTIYIKSTESNNAKASFLNSTIADNFGNTGDGIVLEEDDFESTLTTALQNSIFTTQGALNYYLESGSPIVVSNGGNMSSDESMLDILTNHKDLNAVEPIFTNPAEGDYSLQFNSPGIDDGIIDNAPEFDIVGNPRINEPDMGAYENQMPVYTMAPMIIKNNQLVITPNPVSSAPADVVLYNEWRGKVEIHLIDAGGQRIDQLTVDKTTDTCHFRIPMHKWGTGYYRVLVSNGKQVIGAGMIRI